MNEKNKENKLYSSNLDDEKDREFWELLGLNLCNSKWNSLPNFLEKKFYEDLKKNNVDFSKNINVDFSKNIPEKNPTDTLLFIDIIRKNNKLSEDEKKTILAILFLKYDKYILTRYQDLIKYDPEKKEVFIDTEFPSLNMTKQMKLEDFKNAFYELILSLSDKKKCIEQEINNNQQRKAKGWEEYNPEEMCDEYSRRGFIEKIIKNVNCNYFVDS